jgi:LEA14-like dessication related protein
MLKRFARPFALLLAAALLTGCTTLGSELVAPSLKGLDYQIIVMGDSFAEGVASNSFILPALGEAEFDMLVSTNFVSGFARLLSRVGGGKLENLDYEIVGKVYVEKGMIRKIPFNHRGTVDFSKTLPPIKPAAGQQL